MVPFLRNAFNLAFSKKAYESFLLDIESKYLNALDFRVAETPIFVDKAFKDKILETCESIVDTIVSTDFKHLSEAAIPLSEKIPNENNHPQFLIFDFGICENELGNLTPQLIELQGFPSLFGYELIHNQAIQNHFEIPDNYSCFLNGFDENSYVKLLREIVLANHPAENVVLLEVLPHQQKTRIDFYCTSDIIGIPIVCITEIIKEGKNLYYERSGKKIPIKRIYNRLIFNDLQQQTPAIQEKGKILFEELNVEWVPHPNWFYRISKYLLPFLKHPNVPEAIFLNDCNPIPTDLHNYVLKPLFSFAGQGVVIDITLSTIEKIKDPENWILQKKVTYANIIQTPDTAAKAEIRIFYFWKDGDARPIATSNLTRLSKGQMIGVNYNQNKEWVGGSLAYFEK